MFDVHYFAIPPAYGPCPACGSPRYHDRFTDSFVCIGCGGREDASGLKGPPEHLRLVERLFKTPVRLHGEIEKDRIKARSEV